ncbi:hypothetical protein T261_1150 [Streptomyces lydicus]|nr:hypothetical protein T261_1150 [Streptomyces lydicus]
MAAAEPADHLTDTVRDVSVVIRDPGSGVSDVFVHGPGP